MTNEEAIARIREHKIVHKMNEPRAIYISKALDMAIKALEQEPCEDCISRQAVLDLVNADWKYENLELDIVNLPPVTSQPKMGKWVRVTDKTGHLVWECDRCGWQQRFTTNYCPDCGAKNKTEFGLE